MKNKFLLAFLSTGLFIATLQALGQANGQFSADQVKQIEQITHDYLVKNPQVLIEASQTLQQQQMQQAQKTASVAIAKNTKDIFNNPNSPVVGNPKGNITLVEFMDYQCAHCKEMGPIIDALIKDDGNLRVVFKQLPIFGETSEFAAKAALASQKQGKFMQFHDALIKDQNPLTKEEVLKVAQSVGLDVNQLNKDINNPEYMQQIKDNYKLAQELHLVGTPALIIGNGAGKAIFIPGATSKTDLLEAITQVKK